VIPCSNTIPYSNTISKKFEILGPRNGQILHSGSLVDSYIYVYFAAILYLGHPLTGVPGQIALTAPVTTICDSLVS
jgi:hypothetical protein